jgi:hypothetical protein
MGAGFADRILRDEAPDLLAFTVIVRGARSFAVLVAILALAFKVLFGLIEPRNTRGIFASCPKYFRPRPT